MPNSLVKEKTFHVQSKGICHKVVNPHLKLSLPRVWQPLAGPQIASSFANIVDDEMSS